MGGKPVRKENAINIPGKSDSPEIPAAGLSRFHFVHLASEECGKCAVKHVAIFVQIYDIFFWK